MAWTVAIGVDTHRDVHVAVALDRLGARLDSREIETTAAGYRSLLCWALDLGSPVFALEGAPAAADGVLLVKHASSTRASREEGRHGPRSSPNRTRAPRRRTAYVEGPRREALRV
jgi:hypothetical protein